MDADAVYSASTLKTSEPEANLSNMDSVESVLSGVDILQEVEAASEALTRVELDLTCCSEKLVNLSILTMHVAMRESDYEAFVLEKEHNSSDSAEKALEFDLLYGILDTEVKELNNFMTNLQAEIDSTRGFISSCKHLEQTYKDMEEKLHDSDNSLKQSLDQLSEIRKQSAVFHRILSSFAREENGKTIYAHFEDGEFLDQNAKIKMQTAEQQRHFLRMLEKSLARELDLEKKVAESRQTEEEQKLRLHSSQQEIFFLEEEEEEVCEKLFEAENAAEILMGTSKEILGRLQIAQFNLSGSIHREGTLRSELLDSTQKLRTHQIALHELEKTIEDLKEKNLREESRAVSAEARCKLLTETNTKLSEEVSLIRSTGSTSEKVESLERQLRESNIQLQHALASAEASQEKQSMLDSTIHDMENVIMDLKLRVSKAESQAESTDEKCITLSELNSDLNEEVNFLRGKIEHLEVSLHRAEEKKVATAKDINIRTKMISDVVLQLALERERLHKQISTLMKENKLLLDQTHKVSSRTMRRGDGGNDQEFLLSKCDFGSVTSVSESKEVATALSGTSFKVDKATDNLSVDETELQPSDSTSKLDTTRNLDVRQLNFKFVLLAALVLVVSALAAFWYEHPRGA